VKATLEASQEELSLVVDDVKAREIFGGNFNERLFREQLCYFEDIDFSEKIHFMKDPVSDIIIKDFLRKVAVEI